MASMVMQCMTASMMRSSFFMVLGLVGGIKCALASRTPRLVTLRDTLRLRNNCKYLYGNLLWMLAASPIEILPTLGLGLFLNDHPIPLRFVASFLQHLEG